MSHSHPTTGKSQRHSKGADKNSPKITPGAVLRAQVAEAVTAVERDGRTIDWVVERGEHDITSPLATELLYGTIRRYLSLARYLTDHLHKPLKKKDRALYNLMLVGTYQLMHTDIAVHAAINETVSACAHLNRSWAKGMVNAILRKVSNLQRGDYHPTEETEQTFDHPPFLAKLFAQQYPETGQAMLRANNSRAPMWLRVNSTESKLSSALTQQGVTHELDPHVGAIRLDNPCRATSLPGWHEGQCSVQDLGAQLAFKIHQQFTDPPSPTILDACCAPGGKLFHLLLKNTSITEHLALEVSAARMATTLNEATRLGLSLKIRQADATDVEAWWEGELYDAVLADVPCSGTGTIRRHPDIKLLLKAEDIERHQKAQVHLLETLWQTVQKDGYLLYSTCSVLKEENDDVIAQFLRDRKDAQIRPFSLPYGHATEFGIQTTPVDGMTDGFYYCALTKTSTASTGASS